MKTSESPKNNRTVRSDIIQESERMLNSQTLARVESFTVYLMLLAGMGSRLCRLAVSDVQDSFNLESSCISQLYQPFRCFLFPLISPGNILRGVSEALLKVGGGCRVSFPTLRRLTCADM